MARYPDDGLDDEDYDRPLDEGGDLAEATEGRGPCDGVHDPGAGAHACTVCYPATFLGFTELFDPMVADHADSWGQPRQFRKAKRVEAARWRRTRTALNHLARRRDRRARRLLRALRGLRRFREAESAVGRVHLDRLLFGFGVLEINAEGLRRVDPRTVVIEDPSR